MSTTKQPARDKLTKQQCLWVERAAPEVPMIARSLGRRLPRMRLDDLESAGNEALVRAALRYDPETGVPFPRFAYYRVRGAMLDAARRSNPGSRQHRRAVLALEASQSLLEQASTTHTSHDRRSLEERVKAARALVERNAAALLLARNRSADPEAVACRDESPETQLLSEEMCIRLRDTLETLASDDRALIEALYFQGLSMTEYARRLETSTATVSRRHARILSRISARLRS